MTVSPIPPAPPPSIPSLPEITSASASAAPTTRYVDVGANRVRILRDGAETFPAMLAAIGAAEREVLLEMYWFGSDDVGRRFVSALAARARAGAVVRVVVDAVGSAPIDAGLFTELVEAGGDVRLFHPLTGFWRRRIPVHWLRRDHRKMLVCDRGVGFTGGVNIGRPWAAVEQGGQGWRDDMVEVHGPAAGELRAVFYDTWRRVLRRKERSDPTKLPVELPALSPKPTADVWVVANRRRPSRRAIRGTYLRWIHGAKRAIEIVNAYFVPDWRIRRALLRAVARGIRVRIVVPERGDLPVVQWAMEATVERLARRGVEILAYPGMLHSKTAAFDDEHVTIGSYNLDHRSFRYNLEVNVAVRSAPFAAIVRAVIEGDVARSRRWTPEVLRGRGWMRRACGEVALLFARFL